MTEFSLIYDPNDFDAYILAKKLRSDNARLTSQANKRLAIGSPAFLASVTADKKFTVEELQLADDIWAYIQNHNPQNAPQVQNLTVVAVTACPTGVAHTFMAAEALERKGQELGYNIKVETQGSVGAKNTLTAAEIVAADVVILAADIEVNAERFAGKKIYRTSTAMALKQPQQVFDNAQTFAKVETGQHATGEQPAIGATTDGTKTGAAIYKHLMTGVSFMLPIVVAGGLLIALSFVFGIKAFEVEGTLAAALMKTGSAAFTLMIPILSGYIAYSIANRAGLAAGLIGGLLAAQLGAGFFRGDCFGIFGRLCLSIFGTKA